MTLETAIAKRLCISNVGLFRKQIFDQIDSTLHQGNIEKVSQSLNSMKVAGHVEKSGRIGLEGSRWSITPKGRAAYSVVHDDTAEQDVRGFTNRLLSDAMAVPDDELHGPDLSPQQVDQKLKELSGEINHAFVTVGEQVQNMTAELTSYADRFKSIEFYTNDELDRGLFGIVELIRGVAGQPTVTIQGKAECLTELEKLENSEFLANKTRAILTRVRLVIEELEDGA